MTEDVENILQLQKLDLDIIALLEKKEKIPPEVQKLEVAIQNAEDGLKDFGETLKERILSKRSLEGDVEAKRDKINQLQMKLNTIKTNEEYTAVLHEIDHVKNEILEVEEKIIELMEVEESSEDELREKKNEVARGQGVIRDEVNQLNKEIEDLRKEIEICQEQRRELAGKLDGELFTRYQRFVSRKKTIALVPLKENGYCGGCSSILPLDVKVQVMKGKIQSCEFCSRLLYWAGEKDAEIEIAEDPSTAESEVRP